MSIFHNRQRISRRARSVQGSENVIELHKNGWDSCLNLAVESALVATHARGAAIAMADVKGMVCRANVGTIAPALGARFDTRSGISGACIRTGKLLWCDNVDSDPYVDRESCRGLGIKSVIAAPILCRGRVEGVIEVFSRDVYGFTEADCLALQEIATGVAESLVPRESRRRFGT